MGIQGPCYCAGIRSDGKARVLHSQVPLLIVLLHCRRQIDQFQFASGVDGRLPPCVLRAHTSFVSARKTGLWSDITLHALGFENPPPLASESVRHIWDFVRITDRTLSGHYTRHTDRTADPCAHIPWHTDRGEGCSSQFPL